MPPFQRQASPPLFSDYRKYKPFLRADFNRLCAYCLLHEGFSGGFHSFQVDHFRPRRSFPTLVSDYENLYYACRWCNRAKSDKWPSNEDEQKGYRFVDPCVDDFFSTHATTNPATGKLVSLSNPGEYTINEIRLNRKIFNAFRKERIDAQERIQQTQARVSRLKTELKPKPELISALESNITLLMEKYINPKVPYEADDLLIEK